MDNEQKKPDVPQNNSWLDEMLGTAQIPKELGPDELAVQAAGLTHPDDLELEQILSEDWDSVPDLEPEAASAIEQAVSGEITEEPATAPTDSPVAEATPSEPIPAEEIPSEEAPAEKTPAVENAPTETTPAAEQKPAAEETDKTQFFKPVTEPVRRRNHSAAPDFIINDGSDEAGSSAERKTRPESKQGYGFLGIPHIISTIIWLLVIVLIGVTLGRTLWVSCADLMAFGKPDREVTITITEKDDIDSISQKLGDADLVEYPTLFKLFATLTGKDEDIDVGTFTLNSKLDYNAMINNMVNYGPARDEIEIMIPEGYNCSQIFALLEKNEVCSVAELEQYAANGELGDYWFLEDVKRGDKYCLEGFLFPDTYKFYTNDEPRNVLKKFLDGFDYRFTDVMRDKLENIEARTGQELSIRQVVIIASMIEKETANGSESYTISSVIYNRLNHAADFPFLNIDATLIYALNGNIDPNTGLSMPLTEEQMYMDHPYNTYVYRGLPPGPISNPGRNSLDAALDPDFDNGTFYYYVYNPQAGAHIFARYLWEHEQNIDYVNSLS